jgi:hypothetical protein
MSLTWAAKVVVCYRRADILEGSIAPGKSVKHLTVWDSTSIFEVRSVVHSSLVLLSIHNQLHKTGYIASGSTTHHSHHSS